MRELLKHIQSTGELDKYWKDVDKKNEIARKIARKEQGERRRIEMGSDYQSSDHDDKVDEEESESSDDLEELYGSQANQSEMEEFDNEGVIINATKSGDEGGEEGFAEKIEGNKKVINQQQSAEKLYEKEQKEPMSATLHGKTMDFDKSKSHKRMMSKK